MRYDSDRDFESWLAAVEPDKHLEKVDKQSLAEEHETAKLHYFCIYHQYDNGDQRIFVSKHGTSLEEIERQVAYCCFKCEEFFGEEKSLSNFGMASLLISYYGYDYVSKKMSYTSVDAYYARERNCPHWAAIEADTSLHRTGMKEAMLPYVY